MASTSTIEGPLGGEITLADFIVFVDFLRCLDEFETATRMLSAGGRKRRRGLSPHDFRRAAEAAMFDYSKVSGRKALSGKGTQAQGVEAPISHRLNP